MTAIVDIDVRRDADNHRYEASVEEDGETRVVGVMRYEPVDGAVAIPSTVVVPEYRGRGVAAALVERAFADARAEAFLVRPDCWYVTRWLERHPEVHDLVWSPGADQGRMVR